MEFIYLAITSVLIVGTGFTVMALYEEKRFGKINSKNIKKITDIKQDVILRQGREQFKKLLSGKLSIPVSLL
ncbi:MAG: hypothetical protein A3H79_03785 [Candidatus Levybacteria bacterium RIFCSPLOWO2_02_FULL_36_8b]|nr:MAG: hypothetical protein A3H79_03785 [Candidatus Levybacteria bacterium RIFCSPLOWO2_02_FULL_36_8b]